MKKTAANLANKFHSLKKWDKVYKKLQKHLNKMPVGFPATFSGVERRLLKTMFNVDEAEAAMLMTYKFETADKIFSANVNPDLTLEKLQTLLSGMLKKGSIFSKEINELKHYALVPLVIGMYEMQLPRLTASYYLDTREYITKKFGIEYLTTAVPQMRVIPVEKSITSEHKIATYDEIRDIIEKTEKRIGIADCICRIAKDTLGEPCKATDNRQLCLGFRDFHDTYTLHGWAKTITKDEALAILDQSEKDGLILQPSNEQEPQFICACCACCCGILEMMSIMPRPADFAASNFYAALKTESCNGCGKCVKRCNMGAINIKDKKAFLNTGKCIGCGLCVTTCKPGAIHLCKKDIEIKPPINTEDLYETIMQNKKTPIKKYLTAVKGVLGIR